MQVCWLASSLPTVLHHLKHMQLVRHCIAVTLWLYITIGLILLGGMQNPLVESYIMFWLVVTILHANLRYSVYALVISTLSSGVISIADANSWLPAATIELTRPYQLINIFANIVSIVVLTYFLLKLIQNNSENTLKESQNSAQQRDQLMATLQRITIELTTCKTVDDLYKQAIVSGRTQLGLDRIGIFVFDEDTQTVAGTYGTDTQGNLRDERHIVRPISETIAIKKLLDKRQPLTVFDGVPLYDEWGIVGHGWNIMCILFDGDNIIGWLACDNLLSQEPLHEATIDAVSAYVSILAQIIVRKQAEVSLQQSRQILTTRSEFLKAINKMSEKLHQSHDMLGVLKITADTLLVLVNAHSALIYLLDDSQTKLELRYKKNAVLEPISELALESSLSGDAMKHKRVIITDNFNTEERLSELARETLSKSIIQFMVVIPIVFRDTSTRCY